MLEWDHVCKSTTVQQPTVGFSLLPDESSSMPLTVLMDQDITAKERLLGAVELREDVLIDSFSSHRGSSSLHYRIPKYVSDPCTIRTAAQQSMTTLA